MSNYNQITDFSAKDALVTGDPLKKVMGADVDAELSAISTAIATKVNVAASPAATLDGVETFTNKTIHTDNNTITINEADIQDLGTLIITPDGVQTLTNKVIDTADNAITILEADISNLGTFIATLTSTQTLTNKTIDSQFNTISITEADITDLQSYAPLNSPAFTGVPSAPTPVAADNTTRLATTAFVQGKISGGSYAPIASPVFTGDPTAPTPPLGDDDTSIATTAFVQAAIIEAGTQRIAIARLSTTHAAGTIIWDVEEMDTAGMFAPPSSQITNTLPLMNRVEAAARLSCHVFLSGTATARLYRNGVQVDTETQSYSFSIGGTIYFTLSYTDTSPSVGDFYMVSCTNSVYSSTSTYFRVQAFLLP